MDAHGRFRTPSTSRTGLKIDVGPRAHGGPPVADDSLWGLFEFHGGARPNVDGMPYIPSTPTPFDPESREHGALIEEVRRYRRAGWFQNEVGSDQEVAERARERWWAEWQSEVDTSGPDDGIFICMADPERAIWFDPESDTCEENETYTGVLQELAALSGGDLVITDVVEDWRREPGRVFVSCGVNGASIEVALHQYDDWVDPKIIAQLNAALPADSGRFYVFDGGGQAFGITWATSDEAESLMAHGRVVRLDRAPDAWPGIR
jgi:hypothetical protein